MKPTATDWPGACSHASLPDSLTVIVATRSCGIDTTLFDVGAYLKQPIVEQATHGLMQARVDQFDSLGELSTMIRWQPGFPTTKVMMAQPQNGSRLRRL